MKKIKILFLLSTLIGCLGMISLAAAIFNIPLWQMNRSEMYLNSVSLFLIAIWLTLWIVVYQHFLQEEFKNFSELLLKLIETVSKIFKKK